MEESERPAKIRKISHEPEAGETGISHQQDISMDLESSKANMFSDTAEQQSSLPPTSPSAQAQTHGVNDLNHNETTPKPEADTSTASKKPTPTQEAQAQSSPSGTSAPPAATSTETPSNTTGDASSAPNKHMRQPAPIPATVTVDGITHTTEGLSKSQIKKLLRRADWETKRDERKTMRKEKNKAKKERHRDERAEAIAKGELAPDAWKETQRKQQALKNTVLVPMSIILDCDFDQYMRDNERVSLAGQVTRSYSENKNAGFKTHLVVSSFGGKLRERFDGVLNKHYQSWKGTRFLDEDFVHASQEARIWMSERSGGKLTGPFAKYAESEETIAKAKAEGEVIYLSSDSDYTLTELKPFSTYIIGGLVDKNREKGICHRRAVEKGIKTARLPIGEFLEMNSRKVLTTNHVVEIMLRWLELGDWGKAFMQVIPRRKGGQLKDGGEGDEHDDDESVVEASVEGNDAETQVEQETELQAKNDAGA